MANSSKTRLYGHLLDDNDNKTTYSSAPVKYDVKKAEEEAAQKKKDASLKFQPIKRPQVKSNKGKNSSSAASSSAHKFSSSTTTASTHLPGASSTPSVQKSNFEDWVGDDDDGYHYQERQNQARKNNRKNKKKKYQVQQQETESWDYDDIYDPTRPNNYADYKGSDEQFREHRDWKARLYYWQLQDVEKEKKTSEAPAMKPANSMFAPPTTLNFSPPSFNASPPRSSINGPPAPLSFAPPSFAAPSMSDDAMAGDDPYQRRMRMSGYQPSTSPPKQTFAPSSAQASFAPPPPPTTQASCSPPPQPNPVPAAKAMDPIQAAKLAEVQSKILAIKAKHAKGATPAQDTTSAPQAFLPSKQAESIPPPMPAAPKAASSTISRAPVRYDLSATKPGLSADGDTIMTDSNSYIAPPEDQPRSNAPGQKDFAKRELEKYGWKMGQGLGAQNDGITTALVGKVQKPTKRANADGNPVKLPTIGKIVGGKRQKLQDPSEEDDSGRFGQMSDVVKLQGMLNGLDIKKEVEDNNLMQEIGEEMGNKYGNVERVFVWREDMGGKGEVFVKFTSQLSAVRAVNAMDDMTFAGNAVRARFFDGEAFEEGRYEG